MYHCFTAAVILSFIFAPAVQAEVSYQFVEITPDEEMTGVIFSDINNHNQLVGYATYEDAVGFAPEAVLWDAVSGYTSFGIMEGATGTIATGLNDVGDVVGYSEGSMQTAYLWTGSGTAQPIPAIGTDQWDFAVLGQGQRGGQISNSGIVTVSAKAGGNNTHAFLWTETTGIQTLGDSVHSYEFLTVHGINESQTVIGYVKPDLSDVTTQDGFIWSAATGFQHFSDVVGLQADLWYLSALNDQGIVVGDYNAIGPDNSRAMVWSAASGLQILGVLEEGHQYSTLTDVNNAGVAIGFSTINSSQSNTIAGVWDEEHGFRDMTSLVTNIDEEWLVWQVRGINDRGVIIGRIYDQTSGHELQGLLIPVSDVIGDVDADGFVGVSDLDMLLAYWGTADFLADADGSGVVDEADLNLVLANWGTGTLPGNHVPEPGTFLIAAAGLVLTLSRRRYS